MKRKSRLLREPKGSASGGRRVLIADDFDDFRMLLRMQLDGDNFQVVGEACDGREAVALARSCKPDVIVLDVAMYGMDGLDAISDIKRISPDTKIVVLSGFDATWLEDTAIDLGADAYLQKGAGSNLKRELQAICT